MVGRASLTTEQRHEAETSGPPPASSFILPDEESSASIVSDSLRGAGADTDIKAFDHVHSASPRPLTEGNLGSATTYATQRLAAPRQRRHYTTSTFKAIGKAAVKLVRVPKKCISILQRYWARKTSSLPLQAAAVEPRVARD